MTTSWWPPTCRTRYLSTYAAMSIPNCRTGTSSKSCSWTPATTSRETIGTRDAVEQVYGVEMVNLHPEHTVAEQDALLGRNLLLP